MTCHICITHELDTSIVFRWCYGETNIILCFSVLIPLFLLYRLLESLWPRGKMTQLQFWSQGLKPSTGKQNLYAAPYFYSMRFLTCSCMCWIKQVSSFGYSKLLDWSLLFLFFTLVQPFTVQYLQPSWPSVSIHHELLTHFVNPNS